MKLPNVGDKVSLPPNYAHCDDFEVTEVGDDYFLAWLGNGGWRVKVVDGKCWPTMYPDSISIGDWRPYVI